jgi:hypothetical protein
MLYNHQRHTKLPSTRNTGIRETAHTRERVCCETESGFSRNRFHKESRIRKEKTMKRKSMVIISGALAAMLAIPMAGFAGQAGDKPVAGKTVASSKVIVLPGATKEQLFNKVRDWSKRYTISSREEPSSGLIVSKGEITYPSPTINRIQYTFLFTMKNVIQGNRDTVTFEKVLLKSPTSYIQETNEKIASTTDPITSDSDRVAAQKVLTRITDNLEAYLLAKSDEGCSLSKCPECSTLSSSPTEMKEHMKVHDHMKGPEHMMNGQDGHEHTPKK